MKNHNTYHEYPREKTIHYFFEEKAESVPDKVAVLFADKQITYGALNEYADRVATALCQAGVKVGDIVAITTERSIHMVAAILGILKAGGAYLPIEPTLPDERKQYYLKTANARMILSTLDDDTIFNLPNLNINHIQRTISTFSQRIVSSDQLAYVIFTSGSTGNPKGVMVRHESVVNRLMWMQAQYELGEEDVFIQKTVFTFDVSVWELFLWFFCGASLCLIQSGEEANFAQLIQVIQHYQVTVCHFVPSILRVFLRYLFHRNGIDKVKSIKKVFASGEALPYETVCQFRQMLTTANGTQLHNLYGPTEATVDVTYFDCTNYKSNDRIVPIGNPIWNTKIYVMDENGSECRDGEVGELCISGIGVANGYINNLELTQKSFVADPFEPESIIYRTGDLGKWGARGIEYIGRIDNQVKIHGIRVELEEIENKLLEYEKIRAAIVIVVGEKDKKLVAYYNSETPVSGIQMKEFLLTKLPKAILPSEFIHIENIPMKQNGKADRKEIMRLYHMSIENGENT